MTQQGTPRELRFALIGCGDIGVLRAAALARTPGCRLVVAADRDVAKAESVAQAAPGQVTTTDDWRATVDRPDVDAVIISTPPVLHAEMCIAALDAGKHVLCEKPLARTPEECRAMVEAARRNGRRLATGFNYRFYPSFELARQLLDSGIIGELDHVRSYGGYSATSHNQPWVHDAATVGGGALRDIGIHLIDLTRDFLGDVVDVTGTASGAVWGFPGCEDNGFALLRSSRGKVASVHASWTEWRRYQFRVEIYGTRGCIRATCFPMTTQVVWAQERAGRSKRRLHLFPRTALGEKLRSYRWVVIRSFEKEFAAFAAYTRGEPSRIATGEDGARAVEIAAAAAGNFAAASPDPIALPSQSSRAGSTPLYQGTGAEKADANPSPAHAKTLSVVMLPFGASGNPEPCLSALVAQQQKAAVDIIVPHDATLANVDALRARFPSVRFLGMPGVRTPAELRAAGAKASSGDVVGFLEAHAVPAPDWCERVLDAHAAPHEAVGGPIEKAIPKGRRNDTALNWSVYLADYSRYMLPLPAGPAHGLSDCNVSYKRSLLERTRDRWATEFHENIMHDCIRAAGGTLWFDPSLVVLEQRHLGLTDALRDRFSFGRLFGSTRVSDKALPRRAIMSVVALLMPPLLLYRVARTILAKKRHRLQFLQSLPALTLVSITWMVGEAVGYLTASAGAELTPTPQPSTLEPA